MHALKLSPPLRTTRHSSSAGPVFVETIPNVTISIGRDAVLQCSVDDLENYEVAWVKMDTQTVLTFHKGVITRDKRIRVTNNNQQWKLHISQVEEKDRGFYMCQINTEPMISQLGYLDVKVPPTIIDTSTSSDTVIEEKELSSASAAKLLVPEAQSLMEKGRSERDRLGIIRRTQALSRESQRRVLEHQPCVTRTHGCLPVHRI
ncbi:AGAP008778-PA-like protein [Caerostris extrusa]|uniref:AGAP008778-PA-like protein n=1 Tax=Caerostris extrusa TaxID=172846 RepID=A0AAV4S2M4_CAEEX|nr:AGAP008778-PA-like protein [Caerostris extrusa]